MTNVAETGLVAGLAQLTRALEARKAELLAELRKLERDIEATCCCSRMLQAFARVSENDSHHTPNACYRTIVVALLARSVNLCPHFRSRPDEA